METWKSAENVPDLFSSGRSPSGVEADPPDSKQTSWGPLFSAIRSANDARGAIKSGVASGSIYAAMYVLTAVLTYSASYNFVDKENLTSDEAVSSLIAFLIIAAVIGGLTYSFQLFRAPSVPALLGVCFLAEVAVKVSTQSMNFGWLIFYFFVGTGFLTGFRGALFLRRARKREQAAAPSSGAETPTSRNIVVRHWRGELRLPVSYWVMGIGSSILVIIAGSGLDGAIEFTGVGVRGMGAWLFCYLLFGAAVAIWQCVGIWRSAGHHIARTGRRFWGTLARVAVVIGLLQFGYQLNVLGPMAYRSVEMAIKGDDVPKYSWQQIADGTEIVLTGGLSEGAASALSIILDAAPAIKVVHLNSLIGGWVTEGYKLHQLIQKRQLATYTSTECVSACTIAFLGGSARYLSSTGRLGFHSASFGSLEGSSTPELNQEIVTTLRKHGAKEAFIKKALSTPADDMWYPTHDELLANGVVTQVLRDAVASIAPHDGEKVAGDSASSTKKLVDWLDSLSEADLRALEVPATGADAKKTIKTAKAEPEQIDISTLKISDLSQPYPSIAPEEFQLIVTNAGAKRVTRLTVGFLSHEPDSQMCSRDPKSYDGLKSFNVDLVPGDSSTLVGKFSSRAKLFCILAAMGGS